MCALTADGDPEAGGGEKVIRLYLYVTQSTAEDAEVGRFLLVHIGNVFL